MKGLSSRFSILQKESEGALNLLGSVPDPSLWARYFRVVFPFAEKNTTFLKLGPEALQLFLNPSGNLRQLCQRIMQNPYKLPKAKVFRRRLYFAQI
jgi:hypothetical protein